LEQIFIIKQSKAKQSKAKQSYTSVKKVKENNQLILRLVLCLPLLKGKKVPISLNAHSIACAAFLLP
jgi:hypothetical protein